jgi:nucleoside-diphosphate-sugar epimerase
VGELVVLLTGITGFVGGALAARLLEDGCRVTAVVRAGSVDAGRRRVARSLSRFLGSEVGERAAASVRVLLGDLTADEIYQTPDLDEVTHVVHAAASTSFASTRAVWRVNVDATERLASRMRVAPALRRFLHVSTAYCCGDRPGEIVHEDDAPRAGHTHVNAYAASKAQAELLLAAMGWGDRLTVARPSVVIGHTRLGVGPSSSLYWYYRAMAALRCGPFELEDRRDIVPVDYVADALAFLLALDRPGFGTYHVSAGAAASAPLREILRRLDPGARDDGSTWRRVSADALARMRGDLRRLVRSDAEASKLARGLGACASFGALGVRWFDNDRLLSEGFCRPPSFLDYLGVCVTSSGDAAIFDQMIDDA